ncbi:hypothetical protein ABH994_002654 [Bradyrhizobium yuanmingense]|uniref:Uncharacterized protein n=1 Tax=Bradyrhizobium yuanmingense TaxID=108015 RepID=A0ABV4G8A0_9BRAD|nr:hypothetical protein [Bradyrhizobium yuanmingense]
MERTLRGAIVCTAQAMIYDPRLQEAMVRKVEFVPSAPILGPIGLKRE